MIVLDTHALIWFVDDPGKLPGAALDRIHQAMDENLLAVSCISSWEIHMLVRRNRLELTVPSAIWMRNIEETGCFQFVPIDNTISQVATELDLHADPADRFIAATAVRYGAALVTRDRRLTSSREITTLWS